LKDGRCSVDASLDHPAGIEKLIVGVRVMSLRLALADEIEHDRPELD